MVVTIMVIVGIIGIGVGILAYRSRTEKGIESGISSFRRELHALAPRPDLEHRSSGPERGPDQARGMTIMPSETNQPEPPDHGEDTDHDADPVEDAEPTPDTTAASDVDAAPEAEPSGESGERPDA